MTSPFDRMIGRLDRHAALLFVPDEGLEGHADDMIKLSDENVNRRGHTRSEARQTFLQIHERRVNFVPRLKLEFGSGKGATLATRPVQV